MKLDLDWDCYAAWLLHSFLVIALMVLPAGRIVLSEERSFVSGDRLTLGTESNRSASVRIGDLDGDRDLDLIAGNVMQENAVFFNDGDGTRYHEVRFGDASRATYGLAIGDLDADGFQDIAVANSDSENQIFLSRQFRQ